MIARKMRPTDTANIPIEPEAALGAVAAANADVAARLRPGVGERSDRSSSSFVLLDIAHDVERHDVHDQRQEEQREAERTKATSVCGELNSSRR